MLNEITLRTSNLPDGYPFDVPAIEAFETLAISKPVSFFVGENGSGKSSLIEAIACGMNCTAVGASDVKSDPLLAAARRFADHLTFARDKTPRTRLFFRTEDAIGFTRKVTQDLEELEADRAHFDKTLEGYGRDLAVGAIEGQRSALSSRYGNDPDAKSHGEWFINILRERIHGEGLYLLDEPETPLSPIHQLTLLSIIKESVNLGGQFIIATHSPILMAAHNATIFDFSETGIAETAWEDVEHVALMRDFLADPERFLRHL